MPSLSWTVQYRERCITLPTLTLDERYHYWKVHAHNLAVYLDRMSTTAGIEKLLSLMRRLDQLTLTIDGNMQVLEEFVPKKLNITQHDLHDTSNTR